MVIKFQTIPKDVECERNDIEDVPLNIELEFSNTFTNFLHNDFVLDKNIWEKDP